MATKYKVLSNDKLAIADIHFAQIHLVIGDYFKSGSMFLTTLTLPMHLLCGFKARHLFSHCFEMHSWRLQEELWLLFELFSPDGQLITRPTNTCSNFNQLYNCGYPLRLLNLNQRKWLWWEIRKQRSMQLKCWMSLQTLGFGMLSLGNIFPLFISSIS